MPHRPDSVLYQNADRTVTLLDVPRSISEAQGLGSDPPFGLLRSTPPIQDPFRMANEPPAASVATQRQPNTVDARLHAIYARLIADALSMIQRSHRGPWCRPRQVKQTSPTSVLSKRKREMPANTSCSTEQPEASQTESKHSAVAEEPPSSFYQLLYEPNGASILYTTRPSRPSATSTTRLQACQDDVKIIDEPLEVPWDTVFHNHNNVHVELHVRSEDGPSTSPIQVADFFIPAQSTMLLGDCNDAADFRNAIKNMAQEYNTPRRFDFLLLDPPWPNASAKRKGSYVTQYNLKQTKQLLFRMDLDLYTKPNSVVGIWITNKPMVREFILGPGGFFEHHNLVLEEEWIWLKVTANGEPVSRLDSSWRKPYEVLLLGRVASSPTPDQQDVEIPKRVIVGVPDMHSRKPCLKGLIKPLLHDSSSEYTALEVFARYLVSGWWSWGNEVLRYNWKGWWSDD
jgi:N6-adenosine-specific RNA methylase IME4